MIRACIFYLLSLYSERLSGQIIQLMGNYYVHLLRSLLREYSLIFRVQTFEFRHFITFVSHLNRFLDVACIRCWLHSSALIAECIDFLVNKHMRFEILQIVTFTKNCYIFSFKVPHCTCRTPTFPLSVFKNSQLDSHIIRSQTLYNQQFDAVHPGMSKPPKM